MTRKKPPKPPTSWTIRLPYRTPPLSLNNRIHWAKKAKITRDIRNYVAGMAILLPPYKTPVEVQLVYVPRDNRRRDRDNLVATLKPCIDGLVDAGVIPDDTPDFVTWFPPLIAEPNRNDPHLYLVIERVE